MSALNTDVVVDSSSAHTLMEKIRNHTARVGVVGLGYVGLPLALEFAAERFTVTGIDLDKDKVARLNRGESYIEDVDSAKLATMVSEHKLNGASDFAAVAELDTINICVPTP